MLSRNNAGWCRGSTPGSAPGEIRSIRVPATILALVVAALLLGGVLIASADGETPDDGNTAESVQETAANSDVVAGDNDALIAELQLLQGVVMASCGCLIGWAAGNEFLRSLW